MPAHRPLLLPPILALSLAGCGWPGPGLAGQPGLQRDIQSFYAARAMEANARCPNPQMTSITGADVVEDTPERLVLDIRYYWVDDGQTVDSGGGGSKIICRDRGQRRFTFARDPQGRLEVVGMGGPQRHRRAGNAGASCRVSFATTPGIVL